MLRAHRALDRVRRALMVPALAGGLAGRSSRVPLVADEGVTTCALTQVVRFRFGCGSRAPGTLPWPPALNFLGLESLCFGCHAMLSFASNSSSRAGALDGITSGRASAFHPLPEAGSSSHVLLDAPVNARIATFVAAASLGTCGSCTREACLKLDRYWGGPEAWRRHEDEPRPRCSAADPNCGPEPTLAVDQTCYRPSAARERLPPGEPAATGSTYACSHDGDCQLAGSCGTACVNYRARDLTAACSRHDWLDDHAFCGCVEGACSFFRQ
jgi:hypothetical protein